MSLSVGCFLAVARSNANLPGTGVKKLGLSLEPMASSRCFEVALTYDSFSSREPVNDDSEGNTCIKDRETLHMIDLRIIIF